MNFKNEIKQVLREHFILEGENPFEYLPILTKNIQKENVDEIMSDIENSIEHAAENNAEYYVGDRDMEELATKRLYWEQYYHTKAGHWQEVFRALLQRVGRNNEDNAEDQV